MPSGPKKTKSAKRKNKASVSPPHQGWLRSHLQLLKAPSFGGTKGKEKHLLAQKEKAKEEISSQPKGGEAATVRETYASEIGGSYVAATAEVRTPWANEPPKVEDLEKLSEGTDRSEERFQKAEDLKGYASSKLPEESAAEDSKVLNGNELEGKAREGEELSEVEADRSLDDVVTSPVIEAVETLECVAEKAKLTASAEFDVPAYELEEKVILDAYELEEKVILDAYESKEAPHDFEKDAITPKVEIPHPPLLVHHASIWNCCGLLEVFTSSQH